jgi:hypothetical protein
MSGSDQDEPDWDDATGEEDLDELGAETDLDVEATVVCPYCGETCEIALDPGGGKSQSYVEDCAVCCRPWAVHVNYSDDGMVDVWLEETG